jgi:hypothetical protein
MKFYELPEVLQTKLKKGEYKNNPIVKNIVNRSLMDSVCAHEFKLNFGRRIESLEKDLVKIVDDVFEDEKQTC